MYTFGFSFSPLTRHKVKYLIIPASVILVTFLVEMSKKSCRCNLNLNYYLINLNCLIWLKALILIYRSPLLLHSTIHFLSLSLSTLHGVPIILSHQPTPTAASITCFSYSMASTKSQKLEDQGE